jgi:hypothetical protein
MSLTLNEFFTDGLVTGARIIVHVTFAAKAIVGGASRTIEMLRAPQQATSSEVVPNVVSDVGTISYTIDPLTRKPQVGQTDVEVSDPGPGSFIRTVIENYYIKGQQIEISFGPDTAASSAFAPLWSGIIEDAVPSPGKVVLKCAGALDVTKRFKASGLWSAKHPAEIALECLTASEVPAGLRDTSSFDYDDDTDISHFNLMRAGFSYVAGLADPDQVTATGAIDDARLKEWQINGLSENNSTASGRVYPSVSVTQDNIGDWTFAVNLWASHVGPVVGQGVRYTISPANLTVNQYIDMKISPPPLTTGEPLEHGLTGRVKIQYTNAEYSITPAVGSYLTMSAVQYGDELTCSDVAQQVARLCNASVIERENGDLEWVRFDPDASAVVHWTADDIGEQGVSVSTVIGNLTNKVKVEQTADLPRKFGADLVQRQLDFDASRDTSYTGHNDQYWEEILKNGWCASVGALTTDITNVATSFVVGRIDDDEFQWLPFVTNHGMCGCADPAVGGAQSAARKADNANRFCYFLLYSGDSSAIEIVKVGTTNIDSLGDAHSAYDPIGDATDTVYNSVQLACTNVTRAQLGTSNIPWDKGTLVADVTLAFYLSEAILDRFEQGCPVIEVYTDLSHYAYQVAELVTLDDDILVGYNFDGVTSSTKWEIAGKEADLDAMRIKWTLARAAPASNTATTYRPGMDYWRDEFGTKPSPIPGGSVLDANQTGSLLIVDEDRLLVGGQITAHNVDTEAANIGENLIMNSDFGQSKLAVAANPVDKWIMVEGTWGAAADIYVDTTKHQSGTRCLHFRPTATLWAQIYSDFTPVIGGESYFFSIYLWGNSADALDIMLVDARWYDEDQSLIGGAFTLTDNNDNGAWTKYGPECATAPAAARYARVRLRKKTNTAHDIWVDNVEFRRQTRSTGLPGGQTIHGGVAASEQLTLSSSAHATKGKIKFGSASSYYDEVNDRFGMGLAAPTARCSVEGNISFEGDQVNSTKGVYWFDDADDSWGALYRDHTTGDMWLDAQTNAELRIQETNSGGYVGIGIDPTQKLHVKDDHSAGYAAHFFNDGNNADRYGIRIQCGADDQAAGLHYYLVGQDGDASTAVGGLRNNVGTFEVYDVSDARRKTDIAPTMLDALALLAQLPVREFRFRGGRGWRSQGDGWLKGDLHRCGLVAQDCQDVLPELVEQLPEEMGGWLSMSPMKLIPILVRALQQLLDRVKKLEGG